MGDKFADLTKILMTSSMPTDKSYLNEGICPGASFNQQ